MKELYNPVKFSRFSRTAAVVPAFALVGVAVFATGCNNKQDAATQGAYGDPVASTTPLPAAPPAANVPVVPPMTAPSAEPGATVPRDAAPPALPPAATGSAPMTGTAPGGMGAAPGLNAPFAGGMAGDPNAPLTPTPDLDSIIAGLEKGSDKKAIAAAYATRGYARMTDDKAGARVKYRKALEDYRVALKNDPTNEKASKNKEIIENIYRDMGRPIPGEEAASGAGAAVPGPKVK